jgi:hypothetical protein
LRWPDVLTEGTHLAETFELPDEALARVPSALRSPTNVERAPIR